MKKWMYLIFPSVMLAGFLVIYFSHKEKAEAKERASEPVQGRGTGDPA